MRVPHPYKAMLAICSDLDETPDRHVYWDTMRFLNTTESTAMGPGVGLEVGNSIYFDMPPGQFSYWNTDDPGREMVRQLIRSGHVDCLHSYGDLATTRKHAGRALDELDRHGCRLPVWVDHSTAPTNFGPDIMQGHGDQPGHPAYHADLTCAQGLEFVWTGRVTSVLGQDIRPRLGGLFQLAHPIASLRTVAKESSKRVLARLGNAKYAIHGPNRVLRPARLRDGRSVQEFIRSNPHWGGVSCCETARGIGKVLTERTLARLVRRQGICVLYTHLGKVSDPAPPLGPAAREAFGRLAALQGTGEILVTTTYRLLRYVTVRDHLRFAADMDDRRLRIRIGYVDDPVRGRVEPTAADLQGLTFQVRGCTGADVLDSRGTEIPCDLHRQGDRLSVCVPWERLEFPSQLALRGGLGRRRSATVRGCLR
jgi:hypothetical protein